MLPLPVSFKKKKRKYGKAQQMEEARGEGGMGLVKEA